MRSRRPLSLALSLFGIPRCSFIVRVKIEKNNNGLIFPEFALHANYQGCLNTVVLQPIVLWKCDARENEKKDETRGDARCSTVSGLRNFDDEVGSQPLKNKERKSHLTGSSSSNYDPPRNHRGIVENRSIRTHTFHLPTFTTMRFRHGFTGQSPTTARTPCCIRVMYNP